MHTPITDLSPAIREALKSVDYHAADISVEAGETAAPSWGDRGSRGFVVIINLTTGERRSVVGAWGGPNMFTSSPVDGRDVVELPPNGAAIVGTMGHPRTFARIIAHPQAFGNLLPSAEDAEELTHEEQQAIYCFAAIKGGEYRRDELRRRKVSPATVDSLVERGYLKRNRAGATQITTQGKNARTVRY